MKLSLVKNLEPLKNEKLAEIDAGANRAAESYKVSGTHTAAVYALKRAELNAYLNGAAAHDLSLACAEAKALGKKPMEVIAAWGKKIKQEDESLPKIEILRLTLKKQIREASTSAQIESIMAAIEWP